MAGSNKSGGSFKLPANYREGRKPTAWAAKGRQRRSQAIQEETEDTTDDKARIRNKQKGKHRKHRKVMGAPMRLDRARMAGPAVDPVGWIANVRMQKDPSTDTKASDDTFVIERTTTSGGETDGEAGLSSQRLGDEIVALNRKLPRIVFEKVELAQRTCTLSMYGPWADREPAFLRISMTFPTSYPRRAPKFDLEKSANITLKTRAYLLRGLTRLAARSSELDRPCAEICARFLLGEPVQLLDEEEEEGLTYGSAASDTEDDSPKSRIKMPARRCGASFGPNGELVVFGPRVSPLATPAKKQVESRFLRSYTALSGAMSSLARYSKNKDSDVVQLMSSDFFARRLVSRRGSGTISSHHADVVGNARADSSTVRIFWPFNPVQKPPFLRRRSSSFPSLARPESKGRHARFAEGVKDDMYIPSL